MQAYEPNKPAEPLPYERLLDAADAILRAQSTSGDGTVIVWRDDTKPARNGYAAYELCEAMAFLRRLGLISPDDGNTRGRWRA